MILSTSDLLAGLNTLLLAAAGWIIRLLSQVRTELHHLNDRLLTQEEWRRNHEPNDNERFRAVQHRLDEISEAVAEVRRTRPTA